MKLDHEDELAPNDASPDVEALALVAFESNGSLFGTTASDVLAIDEVSAVTAVPMAPPHVIGLINWRGRPIPLVSIERFAGIAERRTRPDGEDVGTRMLVVSGSGMTIALRCDRVRGVVSVDTEVTEVSVVMGRGLETFVAGQVDLGNEVMIILDVPKFLDVSRTRA